MNLNKPRMSFIMQGESGFTLIEVLIAISIFAIGFLAVGLMQINAMNTTNSARRTTEAMAEVENRAELLMAMPFYADENSIDDDGDGTVDNFDVLPALEFGDHEINVDGPYTVRWNVSAGPIPAYDADVFVVGATLPRSKTIRVWATPDSNPGDRLAELEFAKFYRMDE